MITLVYRNGDKTEVISGLDDVLKIPVEDYLWLDLLDVSDEDRVVLEKKFKVGLQVLKKKKVRHSFRFRETDNWIKINTRILYLEGKKLLSKPVSFVVIDGFLISIHKESHLSYEDEYKEIAVSDVNGLSGKMILLKIFGKILEYDIDTIESLTNTIAKLNTEITDKNNKLDDAMVYKITALQEKLLMVRRNIITKERIVISLSKTELFNSKKLHKQLFILERDIHSILDYISFDFERLEYTQDTLMGLINLKQNTIMKIFTIVSVIFLPPTLIASIYGMNFQNMPELKFPYAYPIALTVMFFLSLLALRYFKKKQWL